MHTGTRNGPRALARTWNKQTLTHSLWPRPLFLSLSLPRRVVPPLAGLRQLTRPAATETTLKKTPGRRRRQRRRARLDETTRPPPHTFVQTSQLLSVPGLPRASALCETPKLWVRRPEATSRTSCSRRIASPVRAPTLLLQLLAGCAALTHPTFEAPPPRPQRDWQGTYTTALSAAPSAPLARYKTHRRLRQQRQQRRRRRRALPKSHLGPRPTRADSRTLQPTSPPARGKLRFIFSCRNVVGVNGIARAKPERLLRPLPSPDHAGPIFIIRCPPPRPSGGAAQQHGMAASAQRRQAVRCGAHVLSHPIPPVPSRLSLFILRPTTCANPTRPGTPAARSPRPLGTQPSALPGPPPMPIVHHGCALFLLQGQERDPRETRQLLPLVPFPAPAALHL